jgi:TPR repeat protein
MACAFYFPKGDRIPVDLAETAKDFKLAADQHCAGGQFNFGVCLTKGWRSPADHVEAVKLFKQAAESCLPRAKVALESMHSLGSGVAWI